jgi:hypothetical protein
MQIRPGQEEAYKKYRDLNTKDAYSKSVVDYAEAWAALLENAILSHPDRSPEDVVEKLAHDLSHVADEEGITGFMYGCAVSALAQFWVHGEALRRWHNLSTQIKDEGEKANESGGVLNPACIEIG